MTQCLPAASQEEPPRMCLTFTNISHKRIHAIKKYSLLPTDIIGSKEQQLRWQDDEVSSDGWVVEEEDDVMDLENYFADKVRTLIITREHNMHAA